MCGRSQGPGSGAPSFSASDIDLWSKQYIRCVGAGPAAIQNARSRGSHANRTVEVLREGHPKHKDLKLGREELDRIITWIGKRDLWRRLFGAHDTSAQLHRVLHYMLQQVGQFRSLGEDFAMQHRDSEYLGELEEELDGGVGDDSRRKASRGAAPGRACPGAVSGRVGSLSERGGSDLASGPGGAIPGHAAAVLTRSLVPQLLGM